MEANFKKETTIKLVQNNFKDDKTKVNADAAMLVTELLKTFAAEGAARASKEAKKDGSDTVTREHFEKTLPQMMLDF